MKEGGLWEFNHTRRCIHGNASGTSKGARTLHEPRSGLYPDRRASPSSAVKYKVSKEPGGRLGTLMLTR